MGIKNDHNIYGSNLAAKSRFFEVYIQPLLRYPDKRPKNILYFFEQGWLGWRNSVRKIDLKRVKFVESLCEQLYKENEQEFLQVTSSIIDGMNDSGLRVDQAEEVLFNALKDSELETIFSAQLSLYKTIFESDFRLYGTIPYFYLCREYGKANKVKNTEEFVDVASSEKFDAMKKTTISLPNGDFPSLISSFDNQVRNAGAGHDRWEITDDNTVVLKVVDARSGEGKRQYEFTQKELRDILRACRVDLWVLRNGFLIFLENNPEVERKVIKKRGYKIREIKDAVISFAANRNFEVKDFQLKNDRTELELSIKYAPPIVGRNGQIFFGTAEAYDIIHKKLFTKFEYQMLDIVKCCLLYLDKDTCSLVVVHMFDREDKDLGIVEYKKDELLKLMKEDGEIQKPIPSKGEIPNLECEIDIPIRVPYGKGAMYEKLLEETKE